MKIEITDEQAAVISLACEVLSRIYTGQMGCAVATLFPMSEPDEWDLIDYVFHRIKKDGETIHHPNTHENAKIAYDIHQAIRQNLKIRENGGKRNPSKVWYDDPLKTSRQPLPVIEGHAELVANAEVER